MIALTLNTTPATPDLSPAASANWSRATGIQSHRRHNLAVPSPDFDTVALVTVEETIDAFTVGLAERPSGEGAHLILQCALTAPDEQDADGGMDTYCLMDEQGAVHYGGIQRAELTDATLRFGTWSSPARQSTNS